MKRLLSIYAALAVVATVNADEPPAYRDHAALLAYRDDAGAEHPVKTAQDWAIRRRHILNGMQQAMGPLPARPAAAA